ALVRSKHSCFNCLSPSHQSKDCNSKHHCKKCNKRHNTLLHQEVIAQTAQLNPMAPSFATFCNFAQPLTLLPTASIKGSGVQGKNWQPVRAFLDSGSQANFITDQLVKRLGLPRSQCDTNIMGIGASNTGPSLGMATLKV